MEGLTFVITGVLECIERDEAKSLIERYGGKVTGNVSRKTNYLVMGRDCGQSKCEKVSIPVPKQSRSETVKLIFNICQKEVVLPINPTLRKSCLLD